MTIKSNDRPLTVGDLDLSSADLMHLHQWLWSCDAARNGGQTLNIVMPLFNK